MGWWDQLVDDALEGGVKGGLRWAWKKIGPRQEGEPKIVSVEYAAKTGLTAEAQVEGFELRWTAARLIDERLGEGWEYVYEPEDRRNVKSKLMLWDKSVLLRREIKPKA